MRDMDLEMGGEFARLDSVLSGRQLPDGYFECRGGCGKLVLGRFCRDCRLIDEQMEAKRLASASRAMYVDKVQRHDMGVVDLPEPKKVPLSENPFAQFWIGLAVTAAGFVALWFGLPPAVGFFLWLSDK